VCLAVLGRGPSRVASAGDKEQRTVRRRTRTRAVASLSDSRIERKSVRSKRRYSKAVRRSRVAAMQRKQRISSLRQTEVRNTVRRARRAELREQRRLRREAAADWRS
jgi:hypothetical protein